MPKIFVLRHQLAEQQARLKQQSKGGIDVSPPASVVAVEATAAASPPMPSASAVVAAQSLLQLVGHESHPTGLLHSPLSLIAGWRKQGRMNE